MGGEGALGWLLWGWGSAWAPLTPPPPRGTLLVAEVSSRFQDVRAFLGALAQLGFKLLAKVGGASAGGGA